MTGGCPMKNKVSLILCVFFCGSFFFLNGGDKQDLWIKAAAEKHPETKLQLFEQYKDKYGEKKDKNLKFLFFNLAQTSFILKKFEKTIEYGEKALTFEDLEDDYRMYIALWLANAYNLARKDYDKAYSYADMIIDLGKSIKEMSDGREQAEEHAQLIDKSYTAPALRIQIRILLTKGVSDNKTRMDVIQKGITAYKLDNSVEFCKRIVLKEAAALARQSKINEAIDAIEKVVDKKNLSFNEAYNLARLYYKRYKRSSGNKSEEDKDRAIECYEKAYNIKKESSMAVKIGTLLSKKDKDKAIQYFAEAFILSESDKESDAYKYLQQLWFKDKAKDQTPEEQEAGFKEIIAEAKTRLGSV